jgi:hypothetical protein
MDGDLSELGDAVILPGSLHCGRDDSEGRGEGAHTALLLDLGACHSEKSS